MVEGGTHAFIGLHSKIAHNIYWQDGTNTNNGSYIEVPESIATKVVYAENHSAIRINSNLYESKWSYGPLVRHEPNNVDIAYLPDARKEFYIRNPDIYGSKNITIGQRVSFTAAVPPANSNWEVSSNLDIVSTTGSHNVQVEAIGAGSGWVGLAVNGISVQKFMVNVTGGNLTITGAAEIWAGQTVDFNLGTGSQTGVTWTCTANGINSAYYTFNSQTGALTIVDHEGGRRAEGSFTINATGAGSPKTITVKKSHIDGTLNSSSFGRVPFFAMSNGNIDGLELYIPVNTPLDISLTYPEAGNHTILSERTLLVTVLSLPTGRSPQ
jgi:hypothetical protein